MRPHVFTSTKEYNTALALRRQYVADSTSKQAPSFAVTGIIDPSELDVSNVALYVRQQEVLHRQPQDLERIADEVSNERQATRRAVAGYDLPLSNEDVERVYEAGLPSHHGKGGETVYDPTYRQAHEIKPPHFALSADLIDASNILNTLPTTLKLEDKRLTARLHKLNVYATGGFFKPHRDTPRGQNHLGTLTFCLPSKFTGGNLIIRQDAAQINVDWARQVIDPESGVGSIGWCFLYSDCEHEVLPVESGLRVTLAYDVFYYTPPATQPGFGDPAKGFPLGDSRANEMLALFSRVFDPKNHEMFFPEGATLGFGLRHAYAGDKGAVQFKGLEDRLKGVDRNLLSVLKQCGLGFKFKAVVEGCEYVREDNRGQSAYESGEEDEDGNTHNKYTYYVCQGKKLRNFYADQVELDPNSWWFYADVMLADDPTFLEEAYAEDNLFKELLERGAEVRSDVVWIAKPSLYESRNEYVAYGNEAMAASCYTACAILVNLPLARSRKVPPALERFLGEGAVIKDVAPGSVKSKQAGGADVEAKA